MKFPCDEFRRSFRPGGTGGGIAPRPRAARFRLWAAVLFLAPCMHACSSQPVMPGDRAYPGDACRTASGFATNSGLDARTKAIVGLMADAVERMANLAPQDAALLAPLVRSFSRLVDEGLLRSFRSASESGEDLYLASQTALGALGGMEESLLGISAELPASAGALAACRKAAAEIRRIATAD